MQALGVVGFGETSHPLGGRGEGHPVPGFAGPQRQPDGPMGLARAR
jgi:hypothetical protein